MTEKTFIGLPHLRILKILVQEVRHDDARWNQEHFFEVKKFVERTVDDMEALEALEAEAAAMPKEALSEAAKSGTEVNAAKTTDPTAKPPGDEGMPAGFKPEEGIKIGDLPDVGEESEKAPDSGAAESADLGIPGTPKEKVEDDPKKDAVID